MVKLLGKAVTEGALKANQYACNSAEAERLRERGA